jgi:hypothetical protein
MTVTVTAKAWTNATLAAQLRGQLDVDPNATGGTVPDRLTDLVIVAGTEVWDAYDWMFRRKRGTLTLTQGAATVSLPADFASIDQRWVNQYNKSAGLRFTSDPVEFQQIEDQVLSGDTGNPQVACIYKDPAATSATGMAWIARVSPAPDDAYTYTYWYLELNPWATGAIPDGNTSPVWPVTFMEGWRLKAQAKVFKAFGKVDEGELAEKDFKAWLMEQKAECDAPFARDNERILDGYGDFDMPGHKRMNWWRYP